MPCVNKSSTSKLKILTLVETNQCCETFQIPLEFLPKPESPSFRSRLQHQVFLLKTEKELVKKMSIFCD